jgi:hypothetical protein
MKSHPMDKNSIMRRLSAPLRRLGVWLAVCGAALLMAGCGNVQLAYNNADTLIMLWGDHYADFSRDQEKMIRPRLDHLLAWHRGAQLPEYARLLARLRERIDPASAGAAAVTAAEILAFEDQFRASLLVLSERALPDLADLALSLDARQIERIDTKIADNIEKYRKEVIGDVRDPSKRKRAERSIDRAEDWLGRLSRAQREQVRQAAEQHLLPHAAVLEERQQRRQELVSMLKRLQRERPPREATIVALRAFADQLAGPASRDPQKRARQISIANAQVMAVTINLATAAQRGHAMAKLQDWSETFQALSEAPRR